MKSGDTNTPDRLERALQLSLRPVDPGPQFTAVLQARLASVDPRSAAVMALPRPHHRRLHAAAMALAASIVMALAVGWQLRDLRSEQDTARTGLERSRIHAQLMVALEITSERLSQAQQRIEQYQSQEKSL